MIARTWHGCVPTVHGEGFAQHLQQTGVEHAEGICGNLGAFVHRMTQGEYEHFFLATYWEDINAIKAFAGEQYSVAVSYPDDEQFELISDPFVFHHRVNEIMPLNGQIR
ncbi:hypothetical protein PCO86_10685 [Pectobacteriaceae bacterium CE70]|nr:hypothetical protein PCO86_10685 [Pectobacteriaceae bacterium CE70]WJY12727.1 hypothetical protein PCO80_10530 [Pectobacteriaceae bacterium C80]